VGPGLSARDGDPQVGKALGPYRVLAVGATGARADQGGLRCYAAEHALLGRKVTLKVWRPRSGPGVADAAGDAAMLDRLLARARTLAEIDHPGILPLRDLGRTPEGLVYLVVDRPAATSLSAHLKEHGARSWPRAKEIAIGVGLALRRAERAGLTPPSLDSAEVLVGLGEDDDGAARIDLATLETLASEASDASAAGARGIRIVGRLLYEALTGQAAPDEPEEAPPDPILVRPDLEISPEADALVMRALAPASSPASARRWRTLAAMLVELGVPEDASDTGVSGAGRPMRAPGERGAPSSRAIPASEAALEGIPDVESATFGRRLIGRPSKRALISGGVAVTVGLAMAIILAASGSGRRDASSFDSSRRR